VGQQEQDKIIEPNYLKVRGVPIGILPVWKAKAGSVNLNQGDILLLTSDGITEATIATEIATISEQTNSYPFKPNTMLNQEGLWQLIHQVPVPFDLYNLLDCLRQHTNEVPEDDQTILSLEIL
jgi:serine phosphatase RsbU (regulator of sigma subunit)